MVLLSNYQRTISTVHFSIISVVVNSFYFILCKNPARCYNFLLFLEKHVILFIVMNMQEYLNLFIDSEYPKFIDRYLSTKTMSRLKNISQFCGCDYTTLYSPLFFYSRYFHSLVVAHMTWHFSHDKKETIVALLHDVGTPCFAHSIDYVFGDFINQESSEKEIVEMIKKDKELLEFLEEDGVALTDLEDLSCYPILENHSPKLCCDRLDGVLHTCYVWIHTHSLEEIKKVFDDIVVLTNEDGHKELGFQHKEICEKFVEMVFQYAKELQGNRDKYIMNYISEIIKKCVAKNLITMEDLYKKKECEIVEIFKMYFISWQKFQNAEEIRGAENCPKEFYVSLECKKRNVIPLVKNKDKVVRITEVSKKAKAVYNELELYKDSPYGYVEGIEEV